MALRYAGLRHERVIASPRYRDGRFHNTSDVKPGLSGDRFAIMRDFLFGGARRAPRAPLPFSKPHEAWQRPESVRELRVTWLGHSTVLLESGGVRVLTDPVFGDRASPFSFAGPKRFHEAPSSIAELPPLDAVLLSHDHYDHLCRASIRALAERRVPIVTSLGVGHHLEALGVEPACIVELDWWETYVAAGGRLSFTATPAQHFSGRGLSDRNNTLWSSWVVRTDHHAVFFSGDTGLTNELAEVGERLGPFDLTMLEIGAFHPAWGGIHLGPENALEAFDLLGGGTMLPVHWGTFDLGLHPWDEPAETLVTLAAERGRRVVTPRLGEPFVPSRVDGPTCWWRDVVVGERDASPELEEAELTTAR